jgi:glycolate oxidase FAD binding subunit
VALLADLVDVCGPAHVRAAVSADAPGLAPTAALVAPADPAQLSAVLRLGYRDGYTVLPRGCGTTLDWGPPPSDVDIVVDTRRLAGVHRHDPGGFTATVGAGTPLRDVAARLAATGQRLPLDPPHATDGATVGGVLATGSTGPLRLRGGPLPAFVRGVEYLTVDGSVQRLAGDEAAELCGSLGALGVLSAVTFALVPLPPGAHHVVRSVRSPAELAELVALLDTTPLGIAAIEADWPAQDPVLSRVPRQRATDPGRAATLAVRIEGTAEAAVDLARTAATLIGGDAEAHAQPPTWWGRVPRGRTLLRLEVPVGALGAVNLVLRDVSGGAAAVRGSAGAGVLLVGLPASFPDERVVGVVETVRHTLLARGGLCTVLRAEPGVHAATRASDRGIADATRLKERYDPSGRLAPGRLPLSTPE